MDRNVIPLSPEMFRELDVMARKMAGAVLIVREWSEMEGAFGRRGALYTSAIMDTTLPKRFWKGTDVSWIEIANAIDPSAFHSCKRPEMDWMAVKPPDIYRFIVLHEIGHAIENYNEINLIVLAARGQENFREIAGKVRTLNEVLADRFAWGNLYPGQPLPLREDLVSSRINYDKWFSELGKFLVLREQKRESLPVGAGQYVPTRHIRKPIPFLAGIEPISE